MWIQISEGCASYSCWRVQSVHLKSVKKSQMDWLSGRLNIMWVPPQRMQQKQLRCEKPSGALPFNILQPIERGLHSKSASQFNWHCWVLTVPNPVKLKENCGFGVGLQTFGGFQSFLQKHISQWADGGSTSIEVEGVIPCATLACKHVHPIR